MNFISAYFLLFSIFGLTYLVENARILGVFQMPSLSHQCVFQPVLTELSLRGHEVIAVTPNPLKNRTLTNLTEIDMSYTYEIMKRHRFDNFMSKELPVHSKLPKIFHLNYELAEAIFNNDQFKQIYNSNGKFNLIIVQTYISPIMYSLSAKLKAPVVGISSMGVWTGSHDAIGNPNPPSLYSEMFLSYNGLMTFYERFCSTLYFVWSRLYVYFIAMPKCDQIARKYLGDDLPYLGDIEKNVSALFLNTNPVLYTPRPTVPTVIPLGQMHLKPLKPLPTDLQKELDKAKNGIIYFSLGSNVKSVNMPERLRKVLIETFAQLPYTVLWKWESDDFPGKPDNVIIKKWLPQQDVLAHPNIKLFITQCGLQSIEEAVTKGVPIVGIPFIADQTMNIKRLKEVGVALGVDYINVTVEELRAVITEVAENTKYRENVLKLRDLFQDQPMTGLERAIWWSEYIIRHKGTEHLRSPTATVSWTEYLLLDVLSVIFLTLFVAILLIIKVFSLLIFLCKSKKGVKTKTQ